MSVIEYHHVFVEQIFYTKQKLYRMDLFDIYIIISLYKNTVYIYNNNIIIHWYEIIFLFACVVVLIIIII